MKYLCVALVALLLTACGAPTTKQVVSTVTDGIVLIQDDMGNGQSGIGTGFIVGTNQIVTNNHVIDHKGTLYVYSNRSAKKYEAEVVNTDPVADIAVIKIKDWNKFVEEQSPVSVMLGNSDSTTTGDKIIVIGHPWGFNWSVSEGIISAKNRRLEGSPKYLDQVDAHLYQGNSGGPIFNEKGQVICVSNIMYTREGGSYGFCIPSTLVKKVLNDFEKFKEVRWRALSVSVGMSDDGYVVVESMLPGGAADKAGLKAGDKLLEIFTPTNHPSGVKISKVDDLLTELAQLNGQDELVSVVIEREGKKQSIEIITDFRLSKEFNTNPQ